MGGIDLPLRGRRAGLDGGGEQPWRARVLPWRRRRASLEVLGSLEESKRRSKLGGLGGLASSRLGGGAGSLGGLASSSLGEGGPISAFAVTGVKWTFQRLLQPNGTES